jgi:glycosyltransferase involved in cell wall biosynthesis
MKVLMTADTVGGVWTYSLQLASALQEHGVEVMLATMGAPLTLTQREEARQIPSLQLFESNFKLEWMEDPWDDVAQAGEWLLSLEARTQPDVIHLNGYAHGRLPWRAAVLMVGHSCVLSWWEAVKGEPAPLTWQQYQAEVHRGLQAADIVVAPSHAMLDSLQRHYGPLPRTRVIYNARDSASFKPTKKAEVIMTAGRLWDEAKNVAALERVATYLAWPVYVAGDNQHPDGGRVELSNLRLLGKLNSTEMAQRLNEAAIYCLPARYEPFGLSVLEAALASCALVLGDIPSLREIWGDAAIFVPPDDQYALRTALQSLIEDEQHRKAMADKAHKRARELTPPRMAAAYLEAYRDLMAARTELRKTPSSVS